MEKTEALKLCRFYKGEEECPNGLDGIKETYWSLEQGWIKLVCGEENEWRANKYSIEFSLDFPDSIGYLDIPYELKATMYNRYHHWNSTKDGFEDFLANYLAT